jgi:hypothetical protein
MSLTPPSAGADILTSAEVAHLCGVPIDRIYSWANAGILPCWRTAVGGPLFYSRRAIGAFAARRAAFEAFATHRAAAQAAEAAEAAEEAICIRAQALWSGLTRGVVRTPPPGALVREARRDYRRAWRNIRTIGHTPAAAEEA